MKVRRQLLNATSLRTHRYGLGSERHNVSLLPGTWDRLGRYTADGGEDNSSAFIQIGVTVLEAMLHPTDANLAAAIGRLTVGTGNDESALLGIASNLRELADRLDLASSEQVAVVGIEGDNHAV